MEFLIFGFVGDHELLLELHGSIGLFEFFLCFEGAIDSHLREDQWGGFEEFLERTNVAFKWIDGESAVTLLLIEWGEGMCGPYWDEYLLAMFEVLEFGETYLWVVTDMW